MKHRNYLILFGLIFFLLSGYLNAESLLIFGGKNHKTFLGCLNCNNFESKSIWNSFGKYGNRFNSNSIWNQFGNFGSEFSADSPWNEFASNPPIIVDKNGKFYGYLTRNEFKEKRADFKLANIIYKYYKKIRENVSEWYPKIFN